MVDVREISAAEFGAQDSSSAAAAVRRIAEAADQADSVNNTLNEQACLQLKYRGLRGARLWLAEDEAGNELGFALLHGQILDLAVEPEHRGQGIGSRLASAVLADGAYVEAWSHADHPAAARIAAHFGIPRERDLLIMRRPTSLPVNDVVVPPGVRIRSFLPEDTEALLEVNAHAFATHPEQGHMTLEDFRERTEEPWFAPDGLLLAVAEDPTADPQLLGFHWTKVHVDEKPPYGEVYVVAVNPKAAGRGLGGLLTNAGLRYLNDRGVDEVILYVDGDNDPAIAVYEREGFERVRTEVQYRGRAHTA